LDRYVGGRLTTLNESTFEAYPEMMIDKKDQAILQWLAGKNAPASLNEIRDIMLFEEGYAELALQSLQDRQFIIWEDGQISITDAGWEAVALLSPGRYFKSIRNSA
jgi:hypothetical protein